MTTRWVFRDVGTNQRWTVPVNPNSMTDPQARQRSFVHAAPTRVSSLSNALVSRTVENSPSLVEWEFGGHIYTKEHHDALKEWAERPGKVEITDHLGRTFQVLMRSFLPTERRPTPDKPWRFNYQMRAMVLRRVQ